MTFAVTLTVLWLGAQIGRQLRSRWHGDLEELSEEFNVTLGATLTLLGLIIGFTFSMATARYDQRKMYEEEEANAIGTALLRVDLLPADAAAALKPLLIRYTELRIRFYKTRDAGELKRMDAETQSLQRQLWKTVAEPAKAQPTTNTMLALTGMNDVLNSQGYTQAAWWNRIPGAAWVLMFAIAIVAHILLGFGAHARNSFLALVLPLLVAIAFLLIADIDSPRGGLIRVRPQNLITLAKGFGAR